MIQFISTGPNGNPGGESRFPPSCKHGRSGGHTTKLSKKKKKKKKKITHTKGSLEQLPALHRRAAGPPTGTDKVE